MKQEGTRDLSHLNNMRPHNLLFTVYPNPHPPWPPPPPHTISPLSLSLSLCTNNPSFTFSNISSLRLSLSVSLPHSLSSFSIRYFCLCLSFFSLPPSFLPFSGPHVLSHLQHFFFFLLLSCHVSCCCLSSTSSLTNRKMKAGRGRIKVRKLSGFIWKRLRKREV